MGALSEIVRAYYEALNRGDRDEVASFFAPEVVHYYTQIKPHVGAAAIADAATFAREALDARYWLEAAVEEGESVCIEWTMTWLDPASGNRHFARGAEFYAFRGQLISEVRSYNHSGPHNRSGDLIGFDHAGRGYMTVDAVNGAAASLGATQPRGRLRGWFGARRSGRAHQS